MRKFLPLFLLYSFIFLLQMTVLFGALLNMMYWTIKLIREKKPALDLHKAEDGLE